MPMVLMMSSVAYSPEFNNNNNKIVITLIKTQISITTHDNKIKKEKERLTIHGKGQGLKSEEYGPPRY